MTDALVDASYLIALAYPKDKNHRKAVAFASDSTFDPHLPDVVLPEVMYLLKRVGGVPCASRVSTRKVAYQRGSYFPAVVATRF